MPCSNGGKIGGIDLGGVDDGISASSISLCCVHERSSNRVERSLFFLLVTETDSERLRQEQHVGNLVPTVRVDLGCEIGGDVARAKF